MGFYSDINLSLNMQRDGDIQRDEDIDAVINSITNILTVRIFNRRMLQEFATNPNDLLFDPIDEITARELGNIMLEAILNWEPRVVVEEIAIIPKPDMNRYDCSARFRIQNLGTETQEINFILNRN